MDENTGDLYIMKGNKIKKGLALVLGLMMAANLPASVATPFTMFNSYAYTGAATVKATSLNVRSGAGTGYSSVGRLAAGAAINIIGEQRGTDGNTWYQIQFTGTGGAVSTGYVSSLYVRLSVSYTPDANFEAYLNSQGFPESYKNGLRQLHAQYPNWVFKAKNTGLDWNTVIENESVLSRNLVASGSVSSWKSVADGAYNWDNSTWTGLDGSNWVAASPDIIRYYMDPRNFLDETYVFQFLAHEYDQNTQTREGLTSMVTGTFLSGSTTSTGTGGSDFSGGSSSGPGSSTGPGSSSHSGSSSSNGPGRSTYDDSQHGPGVSGTSGSSTPSGNSSSQGSPASGGSGEVSLEGPQASITPREHQLVTTNVSLVAPGQDNSSSSNGPVAVGGTNTGSNPPSGDTSSTQSPSGNSPSSNSPSGNSPSDNSPSGNSPSSNSPSGVSPAGTSPSGEEASYIDIIMNAASQSGVSPYVLAAMILQEQGNNGTSPLISGNYSGYEGYYNYFNVEAYQSGSMSAIQMGLRYASQSGTYGRPWNTVEKSIRGGAQSYGENYVKAGQNTFYLKKFNVQGSNPYKHQYMSNVQGAASEAAKLSQAYTATMKNSALEFHIPVFNNMPEQACIAPTGDGSPNNKLSGLGVDGFSLTPSFNRDTQEYNLIVDSSVTNITVNASSADSNATVAGAGNINLQSGGNDVIITVTAQNGNVRTYTIHVVQQAGGPTQGSVQSPAAPDGSTGGGSSGGVGPGGSGGPGAPGDSSMPGGGNTPGGSNVTIVQVQS